MSLEEILQLELSKENDLQEILREYEGIEDELGFNELDISEKLERNAWLCEHWRFKWIIEQQKLDKIDELLEKTIGQKYDWYRFECERELTRSEIEKYYLPKDPTIMKIKEAKRKQKFRTEVFETIYKAFDKQQWCMKEWINSQRI